MNPNDLIDTIVDAIDYAEIAGDPQGLIKARRLLNNDLRQMIDQYVQAEVQKVAGKSSYSMPLSSWEEPVPTPPANGGLLPS